MERTKRGAAVYNNIGRATRSGALAGLRTLCLAMPLGLLGKWLFGVYGLYAALPLASLLASSRGSRRRSRPERFLIPLGAGSAAGRG